MNNKIVRILNKYLTKPVNEYNILYVSDKDYSYDKLKNVTYAGLDKGIKDTNVIIIEHNDVGNINEIIHHNKDRVELFILIVHKKFDFNNFVKTVNTDYTDIYNIKGLDHYFIVTN
jgi:hypothetical protein